MEGGGLLGMLLNQHECFIWNFLLDIRPIYQSGISLERYFKYPKVHMITFHRALLSTKAWVPKVEGLMSLVFKFKC